MSDDNRFHDSHGLIAEIFLRHRHNYVQAICSSHKWRSLSTAGRGQACWICMWSMRSADERKAALNELNGMYRMKVVERFLEEATREAMKPILRNIFGELTILGFIGLVMFLVTKYGKKYLDIFANHNKDNQKKNNSTKCPIP